MARSDVAKGKCSHSRPLAHTKVPLYRDKWPPTLSITLGRAQQAHVGFLVVFEQQLLPELAEEAERL